jgi:fatty-acyl-CoA synthase
MSNIPQARTIPALLKEMAQTYPDREALVSRDRRFTYSSLRAEVRAFAKGLSAMGVGKGSRVAILMGNKWEWIVADLAVCSLGGIMVSVNTWVTTRELGYILEHSDADTLVYVDRFLKYDYVQMLGDLEPLSEAIPKLKRLIHVGESGYRDSVPFTSVCERGTGVADKVLDDAAAGVDPQDVTYLLYTSGSTSTPKGVQLQHYALIENMWNIGERMHVTHEDRLWLAVSLYWGLGCENALFNIFTHGGCLVLQEHFDAGEALRIIEEERCTLYYGTPNMAQAMAEHPDRPKRDLSSLRSGGATGSPDQLQRVADLGAKEICHIYGLTETYGNCAVTDGRLDPPNKRFATVGRPLDGVDLRIVDPESLKPVGPNETGEVQVKRYVTIGYYKDNDKNRDAFTPDGYFRTGDFGILDEDGYLHFRGRMKEMIKTGGINVAPAEVEEILTQQEGVKLALVVGVPDEVRDEIIAAVVVTDGPPAPGMEERLTMALKKELAAYKMPRAYRFVREEDLPLTTTGKVKKNELSKLFVTMPVDT